MDPQQQPPPLAPPSIPPRPSRASGNAAAHAAPIIPPRPVRSKSPQQPEERKIANIPSDMEVYAPVAAPAVPANRPGFLRSASTGTSTPPRGGKAPNVSGIPEIGRQVPMYPNAGDVQAPTPTPSRQAAIPAFQKRLPGSASPFLAKKEDYGEYGSGLHPLERRSGHYSLSSEDLNYIVAKTSKTPQSGGVPDDDIGYIATEEYAKKIGTATPREELPESEATKQFNIDASKIRDGSTSPEISIHVQPRAQQRTSSHPYGKHNSQGRSSQTPSALSGSISADTGAGSRENIQEEEEYGEKSDQFRDEINYRGTPILASDEITKRGTSTPHLAPAISPVIARRAPSRPASRPPSRPPSPKAEISSHPAPLAQVEEHEPLFPDSDDEEKKNDTALREGVARALGSVATASSKRSSRKFPSNDIWEDAPASSHLSATVASPPPGLASFNPEEEQDKNEEGTVTGGVAQDEESDRLGVPNRHKKTSPSEEPTKPTRPVLLKTQSGKQRFPSRDIWEEAPDSAQLTTEVSETPAEGSEEEMSSPVVAGPPPVQFPTVAELSNQTRPTTGVVLEGGDDRLSTSASLEGAPEVGKRPDLPVRPPSPENQKWAPTGASPPPLKPKPAIGGKIAALKANLELEKRLAAGPSTFLKKKDDEEKAEDEEKPAAPAPLAADVRKGRAKGPRGRKLPTAAASTSATEEVEEGVQTTPAAPSAPQLGFSTAWTVWSVDGDDEVSRVVLVDPTEKPAAPKAEAVKEVEKEKPAEVANEEAQENLAKEVLTGILDPPVVVPQQQHSEEEKEAEGGVKLEEEAERPRPAHHHRSGLITEDTHPEDAAPKGQSSLDAEQPAGVALPTEKNDLAAAAAPAEPQALEEEDWDVVSKV
ncbi:hypothetical protein DFH27DRAFT_474953 [Peziza echinospora]|nr:hypothetical protein DFH27DRAFT_474953 [Peziza echinospora]